MVTEEEKKDGEVNDNSMFNSKYFVRESMRGNYVPPKSLS
jgi:hypothetical protein